MGQIQYVNDENDWVMVVIGPIDLWREIQSEKRNCLSAEKPNNEKRLLEAKNRMETIPFDEACKKL